MYNTTDDPKVLFEVDGFQVSNYSAVNKPVLMHLCPDRSRPNEGFQVVQDHDRWTCTHCAAEPPDEAVGVHVFMDGLRKLESASGSQNVFIGYGAGKSVNTGSSNVYFGADAVSNE
jgi:hypothetical protein